MSNDDHGSDAVALLATAVVLVLGSAFCSLMVLFVAENATQALITSSCVIGGIICLIWMLRGDSDSNARRNQQTWLKIFRKRKKKTAYRATRVTKNAPQPEEWGQNRPPSVESVREIKQATDGMRNWSPKSIDEKSK